MIKLSKNTIRRSNHQIFSTWNETSAYLLGLLEADGYWSKTVISYCASEKDKEHVELVHSKFETNVKISRSTWKTYSKYVFTITSPQMIHDLGAVGFRSGQIPKIPKDLLRHWLRGLSDGDGSFYIESKQKRFSLVFSNETLANEVLKLVIDNIGTSKGMKIYKKTNAECWYFRIAKKELVNKFATFIYKDSSIALARKQLIGER